MRRGEASRILAVVVLAGMFALSACGSSKKTTTEPTSGASAAGGGAAGANVKGKLLVIGDFTSTIPFTLPEIVPMAKGVLKGFPNVVVESCDAKGTPAGFLICERKAVRDKVAGVLLGFAAGGSDMSALTKAKIPVIGNGDAHSPNSYPTAESFSTYVAEGAGLYEAGCRKLGIVYIDGSDFLVNYIKAGFEGKGGKEVARAAVAFNAPDASPAVSKVLNAGAECVAVSQTPSGAAQTLTALRQSGKSPIIGGISAIFSQQLIDALKSLAEGLIIVDTELNPYDNAPGITAAAAAMHSVDPAAKMSQQAVGVFVAAKVVAAALPTVNGEATNQSLAAAINGLRNVEVNGVIHSWSSIPLNSPTFSRIFNHYGINYKIVNGKPVRQGDFYDTAALLTGK